MTHPAGPKQQRGRSTKTRNCLHLPSQQQRRPASAMKECSWISRGWSSNKAYSVLTRHPTIQARSPCSSCPQTSHCFTPNWLGRNMWGSSSTDREERARQAILPSEATLPSILPSIRRTVTTKHPEMASLLPWCLIAWVTPLNRLTEALGSSQAIPPPPSPHDQSPEGRLSTKVGTSELDFHWLAQAGHSGKWKVKRPHLDLIIDSVLHLLAMFSQRPVRLKSWPSSTKESIPRIKDSVWSARILSLETSNAIWIFWMSWRSHWRSSSQRRTSESNKSYRRSSNWITLSINRRATTFIPHWCPRSSISSGIQSPIESYVDLKKR